MNLKELNAHGSAIQVLAKASITDPKLKIKVTKINIWFEAEVKLLQAGLEAISAKFPLTPQVDEAGKWTGTQEELQEYLVAAKPKNEADIEFLETTDVDKELDASLKITEDEISKIEDDTLSAEHLTSLVYLNLLDL